MKKHALAYLGMGTLLALSCGSETNTPPPPPPPGGSTIQTVGTSFEPANLTVAAGTTVTWTDTDGVAHTVTSGTGSSAADAGQLFDMSLTGHGSVTHTFDTPGTYPYFCRPHEPMGMRGTVTVTAGTGGAGGSGGTGGTGGSGGYGG
jgi:plastocyanin